MALLSGGVLAAPGAWAQDALSVTEFGAWAGGGMGGTSTAVATTPGAPQLTPATGLPTSGSATYAGNTTGSATIDGAKYGITGNETLGVTFGPQNTFNGKSDFGAVSVALTLNKQAASGGAASSFVSLRTGSPFSAVQGYNLPITYSSSQGYQYTGAINGNATTPSNNTMVQGTLTGAFYGAQAQGTMGNWSLANITGGPSTITAQGHFTAHR